MKSKYPKNSLELFRHLFPKATESKLYSLRMSAYDIFNAKKNESAIKIIAEKIGADFNDENKYAFMAILIVLMKNKLYLSREHLKNAVIEINCASMYYKKIRETSLYQDILNGRLTVNGAFTYTMYLTYHKPVQVDNVVVKEIEEMVKPQDNTDEINKKLDKIASILEEIRNEVKSLFFKKEANYRAEVKEEKTAPISKSEENGFINKRTEMLEFVQRPSFTYHNTLRHGWESFEKTDIPREKFPMSPKEMLNELGICKAHFRNLALVEALLFNAKKSLPKYGHNIRSAKLITYEDYIEFKKKIPYMRPVDNLAKMNILMDKIIEKFKEEKPARSFYRNGYRISAGDYVVKAILDTGLSGTVILKNRLKFFFLTLMVKNIISKEEYKKRFVKETVGIPEKGYPELKKRAILCTSKQKEGKKDYYNKPLLGSETKEIKEEKGAFLKSNKFKEVLPSVTKVTNPIVTTRKKRFQTSNNRKIQIQSLF